MDKTLKLVCLASGTMLATVFTNDRALATETKPTLDTGDTAWMLASTVIVLMMTVPGVALWRNFLGNLHQLFSPVSSFPQTNNIIFTLAKGFQNTHIIRVYADL